MSAAIADEEFMNVFHPGDHGSTFGGNPLGAAVGRASLRVTLEEGLADRSDRLGTWFTEKLREIDSPHVKEIRGQGLMIGVEIKESSGTARPFCEALEERGRAGQGDASTGDPIRSAARHYRGGIGLRAGARAGGSERIAGGLPGPRHHSIEPSCEVSISLPSPPSKSTCSICS